MIYSASICHTTENDELAAKRRPLPRSAQSIQQLPMLSQHPLSSDFLTRALSMNGNGANGASQIDLSKLWLPFSAQTNPGNTLTTQSQHSQDSLLPLPSLFSPAFLNVSTVSGADSSNADTSPALLSEFVSGAPAPVTTLFAGGGVVQSHEVELQSTGAEGGLQSPGQPTADETKDSMVRSNTFKWYFCVLETRSRDFNYLDYRYFCNQISYLVKLCQIQQSQIQALQSSVQSSGAVLGVQTGLNSK